MNPLADVHAFLLADLIDTKAREVAQELGVPVASTRPYIEAQVEGGELAVRFVDGAYILAPGPKALHIN